MSTHLPYKLARRVQCRAATFDWQEDNGNAAGSPAKGTTRTTGRTDINWKNVDDSTTAYTASTAIITAGNNSFEKWQFGKLSGTFNTIQAGLFAHTAGTFGTGLTLKGQKTMTQDSDNLTYTTPSATTNTALSFDMTSAIAIGSGRAVWFGATGPEATGKASSMTTNPCYTNWLTSQQQTTSSAAPGDTATATVTLQYDES